MFLKIFSKKVCSLFFSFPVRLYLKILIFLPGLLIDQFLKHRKALTLKVLSVLGCFNEPGVDPQCVALQVR